MFFSIKMEEYIKSDLFGIVWVKIIPRNIVIPVVGFYESEVYFKKFWASRKKGV